MNFENASREELINELKKLQQKSSIVLEEFEILKQAEEAILESKKRLKEVLENSLDASYKRNLITNTYEYLSPVFDKISGYTQVEMNSMAIDKIIGLIHIDDRILINQVINESLADTSGKAFKVEYRFKHKNGELIWLLDQFIVLRDNIGKAIARIGSVHDITEQKLTEQLLAESEEKYRNVFMTEKDSLFLIDDETYNILDVNDAACQLYGYTKDEILKLKNYEVSAEPEETKKLTHDEHMERIELRYHKKKDGTIFPVNISASVMLIVN